MIKGKTLLWMCLLLISGNRCFSQVIDMSSKMPSSLLKAAQKGDFSTLVRGYAPRNTRQETRNGGTAEKRSLIVEVSGADDVLQRLSAKGIEGKKITQQTITVEVSALQLRSLAQTPGVKYVPAPRRFRVNMNRTRQVTGAERVQAGDELETPFDGSGVLIGVIDQGIHYKHIAFLDHEGQSRAKQVWYHKRHRKPSAEAQEETDQYSYASGHGTHVANIAAGSRWQDEQLEGGDGADFYGIAPKASLYLVSSEFETPELLEEVRHIYDYAQEQQMPCVINMSFGSQIGPHDGTTAYDKTLSQMISKASEDDNVRLMICAANGNEGLDPIHAQYEFSADNEEVDLLANFPFSDELLGCIISSEADSLQHLSFRPFLLLDGKKEYLQSYDYDWNEEISPNNKKQYVEFSASYSRLSYPYKFYLTENVAFGIEVKGHKGESFHAWLNPDYGTWVDVGTYVVDSRYLVGEGAASIQEALSVAALELQRDETGTYQVDGVADFSSPGPWLGATPKPEVAAPGVDIMSAYNAETDPYTKRPYCGSISFSNPRIRYQGKDYYYGTMSGTSMATPVVTGIVALWLQANPALTRPQIADIIQQTSTRPDGSSSHWREDIGYGYINAYEGIKEALRLRRTSAVEEVYNTLQPITISKSAHQWRILFNSAESRAQLTLYSLTGQRLYEKTLTHVTCGQEQVIATQHLSEGVYLLNILTPNAHITRKLIVR